MLEETTDALNKFIQPVAVEFPEPVTADYPVLVKTFDNLLPHPTVSADEFTETIKHLSDRVAALENQLHVFCDHIGNKLGIRVPE